MALTETAQGRIARDGYEAYYAEKIWRLVPGVYRAADGGALRGLVEVLAGEAAVARRSIDRLWADASIVDCDDWVIPYIAELLGTRLISEQNVAGRRADVANTIKYRRLAGTRHLLEMLAEDIAGWDAVASEAFRRLARTWHRLDCPPRIGAVSGTPQHGTARLDRARVAEVVDGPFDDLAHLPDMRRKRGLKGRYNIPKVNLHLFRQDAFLLRGVTPYDFGGGRWTLDPSGRDIALFQPGAPASDACRTGAEYEVRRPLSCALWNDGRYAVTPEVAGAALGAALLALDGAVFHEHAGFLKRAEAIKGAPLTPGEGRALLEAALLPESNRAHLFDDALALAHGAGATPYGVGDLFGADLEGWTAIDPGTPWIAALVDPARGRVRTDDALVSLAYHEGRFTPIGAGSHDRKAGMPATAPSALGGSGVAADFTLPQSGEHQIDDSLTYACRPGTDLVLTGDLVVQAADGERPFLRIPAGAGALPRWVIDADADGRDLTLDGLWLELVRDDAPELAEIVLRGNFNRVCLRHMTLDPGGARADGSAIATTRLVIAGACDLIEIENCVTGPIEEAPDASTHCAPGTLRIVDSIVRASQSQGGAALPAFRGRHMTLEAERCTFFGAIEAARYRIGDSIVQGTAAAQDPQGSCIRYSAAEASDAVPLARAYRCVALETVPNHWFVSRRFGDAGLAQLTETVPETVRRGAETTSEMGAHSRTLDPIKRDDLIYKLTEFTAITTQTQLVFET